MLLELAVVEQRYQAVREVLDGAPVTVVARRFGVARQTVHEWLRRYAAGGGLANLADRSSRPSSCPHQMAPATEARVVAVRIAHPAWGSARILWQLEQEHVAPLPGRSSVYRALLRHDLVAGVRRKRRRSDYRRWERGRAMELWQMDIVGRIFLSDGAELHAVSGVDDHSRFCVSAKLVVRATARPVCDALAAAMRAHGVPEGILTENVPRNIFRELFGQRPAEHPRVVGVHEHGAAVDRPPAGDHAVSGRTTPLHSEAGGAVPREPVEFHKGALVEQQVDALAGRELASRSMRSPPGAGPK